MIRWQHSRTQNLQMRWKWFFLLCGFCEQKDSKRETLADKFQSVQDDCMCSLRLLARCMTQVRSPTVSSCWLNDRPADSVHQTTPLVRPFFSNQRHSFLKGQTCPGNGMEWWRRIDPTGGGLFHWCSSFKGRPQFWYKKDMIDVF